MMARRTAWTLLLLGLAAPAAAGGLRDLADAWLIPGADLRALLVADVAAGVAPRDRGWSLAVTQGRLFELAELPQLGVAVGRRGGMLGWRLRWERLGGRLYQEDQARLELLVGDRWRAGAEVGLDRLALADDPPSLRPAVDLRLVGEPGRGLRLELWWPVTDAPPWYGHEGLRRWLRIAGAGEGWAWAAVVDRRVSGAPTWQAEVMLRLAPAAALGLRCEPWSQAAGFCSAWRLGGLILRTSHLLHPDLGVTHRWGLRLGGGG
jgi:hypothetical protein